MNRRTIGLLLILVGICIAVTGIFLALRELGGVYSGALTDPLGQPAGAEGQASNRMLRFIAVGAIGIPPLAVGGVLFRWGRANRSLGPKI